MDLDRLPNSQRSSQASRSPYRQVLPSEYEREDVLQILKAEPEEDGFPYFDGGRTRRRHSVSSAGSEYDPSSASEGEDVKADSDEETPDSFPGRQSPLKRPTPSSPHPPPERPFKRSRGAFNHEYLSLLNTDIQDAASRFVAHDGADLAPSQIGLTHWTPVEKELFFEALGRLGSDNAAGIAARIRTKGEFEVAQYLRRIREVAAIRRQAHEQEHLVPADFPAAVELSQTCCNALEEAADALSVRQETHEESLEKKRWGPEQWLITRENHEALEQEVPQDIKSLELFRVGRWLRLSSRVFMNASFSEYNWAGVSDEPPAIRTTALEDFYSLVVSVTRRLVAATIYVSESRIRSKKTLFPSIKNQVWRGDVDAAVLSLGLPANGHKFWAGCPRRLGLHVYDDDAWEQSVGSDDDEPEPMTYDEVEDALGGVSGRRPGEEQASGGESSSESDLASLSDTPSLDQLDAPLPVHGANTHDEDNAQEEAEGELLLPGTNEAAVQREARELLVFSRHDYLQSKRAKQVLKARIRLAHAQENHADQLDAKASYHEEKRLWALLGRTPPVHLVKPEALEPPPGGIKAHRFDDLLYSTVTGTDGWRAGLGDVPVPWEVETQAQT